MRRGFPPVPGNLDPALYAWTRAVESMFFRTLPGSVVSTSDGPNTEGVLGEFGELLIDTGSAATRLWQKQSGSTSTTGWVEV